MTQLISLGKLRFNYAGVYSGSTEYEANDVVTYGGDLYVYINEVKADGNLPTNATYWTKILEGVSFIGDWSSSTTYKPNELVQHAGSTWISKIDANLNHEPSPSATTYWDLFVQGDADSILVARGDLIYRDNTAATNLTIGTNNQTLQVSSTGIPEWVSDIDVPGELSLTGILYQGANAEAQANNDSLTGLNAAFLNNVAGFSQIATKNLNSGSSASTDIIAYANNGDNDDGWIDMGITSSTFADATYGVTGPHDGYIFMSAPSGTTGNGNLYLSTSGNGQENDIVFSTGGFGVGQEKMRLVGVAHDSFNAGLNLLDDVSTTNGKFYIGPDAKDLTVDGTTASTQLNGGINSTATTITVDSTTGFNTKGYITINDEVIYYGGKTSTTFTLCNRGYQGTTAASHADNDTVEQITYVGLTNATAIYTGDSDDFVQFAIKNTNAGASASTDLIAYASDGDNDSGWIDLGITSATYADPAFTVTGPGTGYLFFSAPATTTGTGDLLIGTDHTGSNNDIVFFTNGFDAGNERLRIVGQGVNAGVEIYANTESTSTTTGALRVEGGIGLQGNLYVGGDVNIVGNITLGGTGDTVETETLAVSNPIIYMGNGNPADSKDLGVVGEYTSTGIKYSGLVRDASDSVWKLFTGLSTAPGDTVDFTGVTFADLKIGNLDFPTAGKIKINGSAGTDGKFLKTTSSGMEWADAAVTVSDSTTNSSFYPLFTTTTSGTITTASVSSTRLSFNPSTGAFAVKGSLALQGSTSGAVTFQVPATAGSATYTLPSADGTNGYALVTNGSGTLSWAAAGASLSDDTSTNSTYYPVFATTTTGSLTTAKVSSTKLTFNPNSGTLTATIVTASSDARLKENVRAITGALDKVLALEGVLFNRIGSERTEVGVIAQQVEFVVPELVFTDNDGMKSVAYANTVALLIEAIKEQQLQIEELKKRVG